MVSTDLDGRTPNTTPLPAVYLAADGQYKVSGSSDMPTTNPDAQRSNDHLSDFQEGQWWVQELDKAAAAVCATDDFKRAVAVVHHMLRSAADATAQQASQA